MKKYRLFLYILVFSFLFFPRQIAFGTTGNADSFTCVSNEVGNTGDNYLPWFNNHCITPSPKPTETPCPTKEVTPTVTQTPTVTPTPTQTSGGSTPVGGPGDGRSDGRSDGLSSCPSCTQAPQSQAIKAVLGLSTTSGSNIFVQWAELLGALGLVSTGAIFFKKNA